MSKRLQEGDCEEKDCRQIATGEKFGIEKPCSVFNSANFDGIFQPGGISDLKVTTLV